MMGGGLSTGWSRARQSRSISSSLSSFLLFFFIFFIFLVRFLFAALDRDGAAKMGFAAVRRGFHGLDSYSNASERLTTVAASKHGRGTGACRDTGNHGLGMVVLVDGVGN